MARFKLTIEYDGTPFVGWQVQKQGLSVQGQLHRALLALSGEDFVPRGAGRTDARVHARGQVAHIELEKDWLADKVRDGLNYHLKPDPISVLSAEQVDDEFDARFGAVMRHYEYVIVNRRSRLALDANKAWHVGPHLDASAMHEAGQSFIGHHDFTTFRSVHCQAKSPLKSVESLSVQQEGARVSISVSARSFMHNQVRSMVGSLVQVGLGKWSVSGIAQALEAKDRAACGPVAPAWGLYFMQVDY